MADPRESRDELSAVLELAARSAREYLDGIDEQPVQPQGAAEALDELDGSLPEEGAGAEGAVARRPERGRAAATRSSGPRFFHFVMGGGTPAALGADWLTSTFDQVAFAWASSPLAARLEQVAGGWLRQLFALPEEFGAVLTTG